MSEQVKQSGQQDTYSVKTTSAVKEELNELLRLTGLPSKELFEAMVTNYKIMALQGTDVEKTEDVQQVRYHLSRAENLFLNLVQKNQDVRNDYTARISQENILHKQITDELQREKSLAIEERDKSRVEQMELIEQMKKTNEVIVDLTDRGRSDRITIDVLTRKTEELEAQVTALPGLKEQAEKLNQDKTSLEHKVDGLQAELSKYKELLEASLARISDISQERERAVADITKEKEKSIQRVEEIARKDIEQLEHVHQLELDKAVLEAINKTRDEFTGRMDSLVQKNDAITARNQELVDRIHALELKQTTQAKK